MINVFGNLRGDLLPTGFTWLNEPQSWEFTDTGLIVRAKGGTDFFRDPAGGSIQDSAHFLYTKKEGDFTFQTKVKAEMLADYDAACLMVRFDGQNWAKLCYEYTYQKPMIVSVVTRKVSDDCNSLAVPEEGVYLRVTRFADCFAFHYSLDGEWWELIRYFTLGTAGPVMVGIVAQSPTGAGCTVQFADLKVSAKPVREIRSGK